MTEGAHQQAQLRRPGNGLEAPAHSLGSRYPMLAALAMAGVLQPLNMTMLVVGLPVVRDSFDISSAASSWIITAFVIGMAVSQPIAGKIVDRFARKKVFLFGVAYFGLASVLAGLAWNFPLLLFFRVNQAVGTGIMMPTLAAIVRTEFPENRRGSAMGMIFGLFAIASMAAPPLGGLLTSTLGWRSMFFINAPLTGAAIYFGLRHIPRRPAAGPSQASFDYRGAAALTVGLLALVLFATSAPKGFEPAVGLTALLVVGVASLALFVRLELATEDPVVDLRLFRIPSFAFATATLFLSSIGMLATFIGVSLFLSDVRGASPARTGLVLTAPALMMLVVGPLGGRVADRVGRRAPIFVGTAALAGSLVMLAFAGEATPLWYFVVAMLVHGVGVALPGPVAQTAAVEACPEGMVGMAAGTSATFRSLGSVVGSALVGGLAGSSPSEFRLVFMIGAGVVLLGVPMALGVHTHVRERAAAR